MGNEAVKETELKIMRKVIADGLKLGYRMNVDNGGDEEELPKPSDDIAAIIGAMRQTDDENLIFYKDGKRSGWVRFIYSNGNGGLDVICDYTVKLEPVMKEVNTMVDEMSAR